MTWLYAIGLKALLIPVFAYLYWLLAIKGGNKLVALLIPSKKWREILTKERYF